MKPEKLVLEEDDEGNLLFEDRLSEELAWGRALLDPLSFIGSKIPPGDTSDSDVWSDRSMDYYLRPFIEDGKSGGFLTITGLPRTGKTGIGALYGEMAVEAWPGTEVLSNIPLEKSISWVRTAIDMPLLLEGVADALLAERRWTWIYDEPSLSGYSRAQGTSRRSVGLDRWARIIPKLGGSLIYLEQREEGVPTTISDFAQSHVYTISKGVAVMDLSGRRTRVRGIPKPSIYKYRTGEAGHFEVPNNFPFDDLFRALKFDPLSLTPREDVRYTTQGERLKEFVRKLTPKIEPGSVTCVYCSYSWMPRGGPPERCPNCMKRHPLGQETELPIVPISPSS